MLKNSIFVFYVKIIFIEVIGFIIDFIWSIYLKICEYFLWVENIYIFILCWWIMNYIGSYRIDDDIFLLFC